MKMKKFTLFVCIAGVLLLKNADASGEKNGVSSDYVSPSPSGSEIVFSADFDGPTRLWACSADGKNLRKLSRTYDTLASVYETEPAWSPDGRRIAFVSVNSGVSDVWVMQSDGAYPVQLTSNGANNSRPSWSPDGTKIIFISDKGGSKDIWLMNADGTGQMKILALNGEENRPAFSPSGDRIVFAETRNGYSNLMIANNDGSQATSITTGNFQDWDPYWGPNGIVFASNRDPSSEHWKLWMVQPDGSGLRQIGNVVGLSPAVLKDGRIFYTDETMARGAISSIGVVDPATGKIRIAVDVQGYFTPIDIRPGKPINRLKRDSRGKIAVTILSTKGFDATRAVNQASITFGRTGSEQSLSKCSKKYKDVNQDGLPDLTCRFWIRSAGFQSDDDIGILRFASIDEIPYEGRDKVAIVDSEDPDDFLDDE